MHQGKLSFFELFIIEICDLNNADRIDSISVKKQDVNLLASH